MATGTALLLSYFELENCSVLMAAVCEEEPAPPPAGVVNAGFLLHEGMRRALCVLQQHCAAQRGTARTKVTAEKGAAASRHVLMTALRAVPAAVAALLLLCSGVGGAVMVAAPLAAHQAAARAQFCLESNSKHAGTAAGAGRGGEVWGSEGRGSGVGGMAGSVMSQLVEQLWLHKPPASQAATGTLEEPRPAGQTAPHPTSSHTPEWCATTPWWWPAAYGRVQAKYWGVGPFKYWRPEQVRRGRRGRSKHWCVYFMRSNCGRGSVHKLTKRWGWAPLHGRAAGTGGGRMDGVRACVRARASPHPNLRHKPNH